jgi:PPOX class probable F420-dependent enzyme
MSAYGVPDDLDGALPWSWAEERLVANRNYWVVTASADGRPHAMPVWGVWRPETGTFWFSCDPGARKARNLVANPRVSVAVDDTVHVVVVEGTATAVDPTAAEPFLDDYVAKYWETEQERADGKAFLAQNLVVEVSPARAFGIIEHEEDFARAATRWVW